MALLTAAWHFILSNFSTQRIWLDRYWPSVYSQCTLQKKVFRSKECRQIGTLLQTHNILITFRYKDVFVTQQAKMRHMLGFLAQTFNITLKTFCDTIFVNKQHLFKKVSNRWIILKKTKLYCGPCLSVLSWHILRTLLKHWFVQEVWVDCCGEEKMRSIVPSDRARQNYKKEDCLWKLEPCWLTNSGRN